MSKLTLSTITALCLLVVLSVAFNLHSVPKGSGNLPNAYVPKERLLAQVEWRETLQNVPAYYQPPEQEHNTEDESVVELKPKITDAALIGVLMLDQPQALLLLPDTNEVKYLNIGDSWLAPWVLENVFSDYVVWSNNQTNEKLTQKLF